MEQQMPLQNGATRLDVLEVRMFKKRLTGIGFALVGYYLMTLLTLPMIGVISAFAMLLGPNSDPALQEGILWGEQILLSALMLLVPFLIAAKVFHFRLRGMFHPRKADGSFFLVTASAGMGLCMVASLAAGFVTSLFTSVTGLPGSLEMPVPKTAVGVVLFFLAVAVEAPILEEYVFRGVILQSLRPFGSGFAIVVSASFFAILHGNVAQGVGTVFMGLVFGFLAVKSESLLPSILLHAINNTIACVEMLLMDRLGGKNAQLISMFDMLFMALLLVIGLTVLVLYTKKHPGFLSLEEPTARLSCPVRKSMLFRNPMIILFLIAAAGTFALNMIPVSVSPDLTLNTSFLGGLLW